MHSSFIVHVYIIKWSVERFVHDTMMIMMACENENKSFHPFIINKVHLR